MVRAVAALTVGAVLAACGAGGGTLTPAAVTPRPSAVAAASAAAAATSSPTATASLIARSSAPASSPSPAQATAPTVASERPVACTQSASGPIIGEQALIVDVRVGSHEGYDRIVFEFASRHAPATGGSTYEIGPAAPPYLQDPRGLPLAVAGDPVLKITLRGATAVALDGGTAYAGSGDFLPGFPVLRELEASGDFEAVSRWFVGLNGTSCVRAEMLTDPFRLVIDLRRP